MNIDVMEDVLRTIANANLETIVSWSKLHNVDPHIIEKLRRGYKTQWMIVAEYRGALVYVYREMARFALEHMNDK